MTVNAGGQIRLASASTAGEPRVYNFGGDLMLNSRGRGGDLPAVPGLGIEGGLRFEPENLLGIEKAESKDIQGLGWVQAQSQDLVEAELARQVAEFMASEYPHCQVHVSLDVSFDEYGFLKEFRGMEVELCPAVEGIVPVVPVVIGKGENTPAAGSGRPGLAEDLARHLGISAAKLKLRVYADGGSCP